MLRTSLLLFTLITATALSAQTTDALGTLTGASSQKWSVIGTTASTGGACNAGEVTYTFSAKPAQVVVAQCVGGTWKSSTEAVTTWSASGKNGIAFGGARYEVKSLPASAPVCKGNAVCVRLVTVPDGKSDATRTIYLTH